VNKGASAGFSRNVFRARVRAMQRGREPSSPRLTQESTAQEEV